MTLAKAAELLADAMKSGRRKVTQSTERTYRLLRTDVRGRVPVWVSIHDGAIAAQIGAEPREWVGELADIVPLATVWLEDELKALASKHHSGPVEGPEDTTEITTERIEENGPV